MTEQEFTYLSHRIRGKLTALAKRFNRVAGCDGDAEDVVQDALITLWQLAEKGYPIRDPEALAVKITKTCCVERYRRQHIRFEPIENISIADGADMVEPTYFIDGKKASKKEFGSLNADDIKSITVEKDGVIKVVTKAGKKK